MTTTLTLALFLLASSALVAGVALGVLIERRQSRRIVRHRLGL